MATTPLWVPLAVAGLAVVGTLAGVIFTQIWNSRLEERRWARESERLREAQAREDVNRTYEHRRAAYVDFLQEFERLKNLYLDSDRRSTLLDDGVFEGLAERFLAVQVYGTDEAEHLALKCAYTIGRTAVQLETDSVSEDVDDSLSEEVEDLEMDVMAAGAEYRDQIRKDLGVPEWKPAEDPAR